MPDSMLWEYSEVCGDTKGQAQWKWDQWHKSVGEGALGVGMAGWVWSAQSTVQKGRIIWTESWK